MAETTELKKSDFYFDLPQELIAQDPLEDRSSSRLLVLDKKGNRPAACSFSRKTEKAICRLSKDRSLDAIDRTGKSRFDSSCC